MGMFKSVMSWAGIDVDRIERLVSGDAPAPQVKQSPPPMYDEPMPTQNHLIVNNYDVTADLNTIIGLSEVKREINNLVSTLLVDREMLARQSLHMIFTGKPGTGKTSVARMLGNIFYNIGLTAHPEIMEVTRKDIVDRYVGGGTSQNMTNIFAQAMGGILFIDEAYSLTPNDKKDLGYDAVNTLVELMENYRDSVIVIVAGYPYEMTKFFEANSGLKSRFPIHIDFPDYTPDELADITSMFARNDGYIITDAAKETIKRQFEMERGLPDFDNARRARSCAEKAIRKYTSRIVREGKNPDRILEAVDFMGEAETTRKKEPFDLQAELDKVIGMENVKRFAIELQAMIKIRQMRQAEGLSVGNGQSLHMAFLGNPGTGKTTMARIIGKTLYSLGVTKRDVFIEAGKQDFVAEYMGQTSHKTTETFKRAMGGVLFIDEAYSLVENYNGDGYGKEALETLLKLMEDCRESVVVIVAGYKKEMQAFFAANPGIPSRFPTVIDFPDYKPAELMQIMRKMADEQQYKIEDSAKAKILDILNEAVKADNFDNARFARNLLEAAIRNQSVRLCSVENLTREDMMTLKEKDFQ